MKPTKAKVGKTLFWFGCGITTAYLLALTYGMLWLSPGPREQVVGAFIIAAIPALIGILARHALAK